jgi:predicted PurR-regulated permease PerM
VRSLEDRTFLLLVALASLAFAWLMWPLSGAILWGVVLAIVFAPLQRNLTRRFRGRSGAAALATMLIIILIVVLPMAVIAAALLQEAAGLYDMIQSGALDFGLYFQQMAEALPQWMRALMTRFDVETLAAAQGRLAYGLQQGSQFLVTQILGISQSTVQFFINLGVMMYLLFFLLRDGEGLFMRIKRAIPLRAGLQIALFEKFVEVVRATVKGDVLVAILQGALGGAIFWILGIHAPVLWAVLMAFLSLLPAIGAAIVWLPVAIYLLAIGLIWQGVVLVVFGAVVIGLVDNVVRPMLVGKDTKMPDYLVLVSTISGLQLFGLNGFVLGPVIAAVFLTVWEIFSASRNANVQDDSP